MYTTLAYLSLMISAILLLGLTDIRYYSYFDSRLDFRAIEYFNQGRTFWHMIFSDAMFYPFITVWLLASALLVYLISRLYSRTRSLPHRHSWVSQIILFAVLIVLTAVGIRGRLGMAPLNWSLAYFSQNHSLNQLGLNGIYTLARAYGEEGHDPRLCYLPEGRRFPFVDFREGLNSVRTLLQQENDEWLEPESTLVRLTHQPEADFGFKPNVVIVLMESFSGRNTSALGAPHILTPYFDRLSERGFLFTNFYANGTRSNYGLPAVLCSFPSLPGRSIMKRYNADHPFISLSEILHNRGYYNTFAYGGDLQFDNMEGFFTARKYDRFYGEDDFGSERVFARWGIPDHVVYEMLTHSIDSFPRPFQLTILTLSNHEPFDLPDSSVQQYFDDSDSARVFNATLYADHALGKFMEQMQANPVFDSTIFVFTADHAKWGRPRFMVDPKNFHIPLLIYSPPLLGTEGRRIDKVGSQTDILPTLMGILGSDYTHSSWGRDLLKLSPGDSGYAVLNVLNWCGYVERDYLYYEHVERSPQFFDTREMADSLRDVADECPDDFARMQRRMRTLMQVADQLSTPTAR